MKRVIDMYESDFQQTIETTIKKLLGEVVPAVNDEKLIGTEEACKLFVPAISRQTLANWTKEGLLKVYKLSGRIYYKQSEIISAAKELKPYKKTIS